MFDFIVLYYQLPVFLEIDSNEPLPLRPAAGADAHKIIVSTRIRVVLGEQYTIFLLIVFITLIIKNVYNRIFFKIGYKKKRETCYLPVPRFKAVALPNLIEPTTRSPRRI